jgi:hypothetical protein
MLHPPQLGQIARALHENGTRRSHRQASYRTRAKPRSSCPHPEEVAELALDEAG